MTGRKGPGGARQTRPLTRDRLSALLNDKACRCEHALLDPGGAGGWTEDVLADWGHCGMLAEQSGRIVGYLALAPAGSLPQVGSFVRGAFATDAAVLISARVVVDEVRQGVGRALVQAAAADLVRRKVVALEALGPGALADPGVDGLPDGWLRAVGFRLVRPHPLGGRYRMDLDTTVRWRPDLASAWERLWGLVTSPVPVEPAQFAPQESQSPISASS